MLTVVGPTQYNMMVTLTNKYMFIWNNIVLIYQLNIIVKQILKIHLNSTFHSLNIIVYNAYIKNTSGFTHFTHIVYPSIGPSHASLSRECECSSRCRFLI